MHKLYGAYGEKKLYGKVHVGVIRSTLVINPDGSVVIARYNVRAKGHVDSLLKGAGKVGEAGEVVRSRCSDTVVRAVCAV